LCQTLAGNDVPLLTITNHDSPIDVRQKQVIVLTGRVHPGESPASWLMRGVIHYLTGSTEAAERLRNQFLFKIVPMLNPDGVIVGNTR
jgi:cytosolic carboxypeptidase protein 2/3